MTSGRNSSSRLKGPWNAWRRFTPPSGLGWLLQPGGSAFFYALRTALAACMALGIAFWLEMDSPGWAAVTVCSVAQLTRGESLSKARWRLVGTFIGLTAAFVITAIAPQYPWMFFLLIAIWLGACTTLATFTSNFRSYAWVLAGYTCAIIGLDAAPDGNKIFEIGMARATYIVLGILCETGVAVIFSANLAIRAKAQMQNGLLDILSQTSQTMRAILNRDPAALADARRELSSILALDGRIEFLEMELEAYSHAGDHARAALNALSILVSRSFGMSIRLDIVNGHYPAFEKTVGTVNDFLAALPESLKDDDAFPDVLADLRHLRDICRQCALPPQPPDGAGAAKDALETEDATNVSIDGEGIKERLLFVALSQLLGDLESAILEFHASTHSPRGDKFKFYRARFRDWKLARRNGIRAALALLSSALIFECTAWSEGFTLCSITGLCVGLFATNDSPVIGSLQFLKGAALAWCAAFFLVLVLMPMATIFEPLIILFGGTLFIAGLARCRPALRLGASSFMLLLPGMLGFQNHHVMNEIQFWNNDMAIVCAALISVLVFRTIWPYDAQEECRRIRKALLKELRGLAAPDKPASIQIWVSHASERFTNLLNHAGQSDTPFIRMYLRGVLSTLTLGLNILRLRFLLERDYLPPSARRPIILLLRYIRNIDKTSLKAANAATMAIERLIRIDKSAISPVAHLEVTEALTYLIVMQRTLATEGGFLTSSHMVPEATSAKARDLRPKTARDAA